MYDICSSYGHNEFDFTIVTLEDNFDKTFYEAYDKTFKRCPGFENRSYLHHLFAYTLITNDPCANEDLRTEAKDVMKKFLSDINQPR